MSIPSNSQYLSAAIAPQTVTDSLSTQSSQYYRFNLQGRSSLNLSLNGLSDDADLSLLNSNGDGIAISQNSGISSELLAGTLNAGTYYIEVSPGAATTSPISYSLRLSTESAVQTNLVWRYQGAGGNNPTDLWTLDGSSVVTTSPLFKVDDANWRIQATGDFNKDGVSDVVWRYQGTGNNHPTDLWLMDKNGAVTNSVRLFEVNDPNWEIQGAGDFNGDGNLDIVWRYQGSGDNTPTDIWYMNGKGGVLTSARLFNVNDTNWEIQGVGDFNNDGHADLIWRYQGPAGNNPTDVWYLDGNGGVITTTHLFNVNDPNWQINGVADFNHDGNADIVWRYYGPGGDNPTDIWSMDGKGNVITSSRLFSVDDPNWEVTPITNYTAPPVQNYAPSNLQLSGVTVNENSPTGTLIGKLSSADPNLVDSFTYSLLSDAGGRFQIVGNELQVKDGTLLDYEAGDETLDQEQVNANTAIQVGADAFDQSFTAGVTGRLSKITVAASSADPLGLLQIYSGSTPQGEPLLEQNITLLQGTTPDQNTFTLSQPLQVTAGKQYTFKIISKGQLYGLVSPTDVYAGGSFDTTSTDLKFATYVTAPADHTVVIQTMDAGGLSFARSFTINLNDVNEPPVGISLSSATIAENSLNGTGIGILNTLDPDLNDSFTYQLLDNAGGRFKLDGNQLEVADGSKLDFETNTSHQILVQTTDAANHSFTQTFTIGVTNVHENPTLLSLSSTSTDENVLPGTIIGSFSSSGPDDGNPFSYSLISGDGDTDNSAFTISNNQLSINASPNFEQKSRYNIRVRTTDNAGLTLDQTFAIAVNDLNEVPALLSLSSLSVNENVPANSVIGTFATSDPDSGNTFVYSLINGVGDTDNTAFTISNNQLLINTSPNFEAKTSYGIRVRTTDQGGLFADRTFTINVNDLNEAPTAVSLSNNRVDERVAANTVIGLFSSADPDSGNTFSYGLVSGAGSTDNSAFTISNNQLLINASPDFETKSSYSIRVRSTDQGGLLKEQTFTVGINDINEAPLGFSLDKTQINENVPTNSVVGSFNTTDLDANNSFSYSLVTGTGDTDNSFFTISNNQLVIQPSPDFEGKSSYSIRVRSTDQGGLSAEQTFTIKVNDLNEAPTTVSLTPLNILENVGPEVASFSTIDPDTGSTFSYSLVTGTGDTDNNAFTIAGSKLLIKSLPDFETKSSYSIRVRSSDQGGLFKDETFILNVVDVNEAPAGLSLSNTQIDENVATTIAVGTFNTTDQDTNSSFSYSLVAGVGSTDNSAFNIIGNQLFINASPNFEAKSSYNIRVRTTDQGDLFTERTFSIGINDLNEIPINLSLSTTSINENVAANSLIGTLSTTDQDAGDSFSYALVGGFGSTDNSAFTISSNQLRINASPDFENQSSYSIRVRTTDKGGLFTDRTFTINVNDLNESPTALNLDNNTTPENALAGALIGKLSTVDPDANNTFSYSLIAGTGGTDNAAFTIQNGNELHIVSSPNFEAKSSYNIRVRTVDQGGLSNEQTFTIGVTDVNEGPTAVSLSNTKINENVPAGSVVGSLSTLDPDQVDTFSYSIVSGLDGSSFNISNNQLLINTSPNFETQSSYGVIVRSTDKGGLTKDQTFTIGINNVNEAPTFINLSNNTITENIPNGPQVGIFTTSDPDLGDTFSYSLVSGAGSTDNASFTIAPDGTLLINPVPNYEQQSVYNIRVRSTDKGGLSTEQTFAINVADVNEAPTGISLSSTSINENLPTNSVVGSLAAIDPDFGGSFSYALVTGTGSTDNASFSLSLSNNQLILKPSADFEAKSSYSIRLRVTDQGGLSKDQTFTIQVNNINDAPVLSNSTPLSLTSILEDVTSGANAGTLVSTLVGGITDQDAGAQKGIAVTSVDNTNGSWEYSTNGGTLWTAFGAVSTTAAVTLGTDNNTRIHFVPNANYNGSSQFNFVAWDQTTGSNGSTANTTLGTAFSTNGTSATIAISAVNDAPGFTAGANVSASNIAAYNAAWATAISAGPTNESGQSLTFVTTNDSTSLFTVQPTIDPLTGNLSFTPVNGATGTATVTVKLQDNGGTANGGVDTSASQTFTITLGSPVP